MEDQNEKQLLVSEKRTFAMEVEVFADSDEELHEIAHDIGGEVFGRLDVIGVNILA